MKSLIIPIITLLFTVNSIAQPLDIGADVDSGADIPAASSEALVDLLYQAADQARTLADEQANPLEPMRNPFADAAVTRLNESAVSLYQKLDKGNSVFSPLSLFESLRIVYAGAKNDTAKQFQNALSLDLFPLGYKSHSQELQSTNAVWVFGTTVPLTNEFKAQTAGLKEGIQMLPANVAMSDALAKINQWFKEKTQGRIEMLFEQLHKDSQLVIGNAVFFRGVWENPFDKKFTAEAPFYGLAGEQIVKMMHTADRLAYYKDTDYAAVKIPYQENRFAMTVILPNKKIDFKAFKTELLVQVIRSLSRAEPEFKEVELLLPKWNIESSFDLVPVLKSFGIADAFSDAADFSGITGDRSLNIDQVIQKANITVDEEGTAASAATGIGMKMMSAAEEEPTELKADRPFIYSITDERSGLILFIGEVTDVNP